MSLANPRWGAPRLHGELRKIGVEGSQTSVAKYLVRHRNPPSQTWRTFLKNHTKQLVSVGFFIVPTIAIKLFFVFERTSRSTKMHPLAEQSSLPRLAG